MKSKPFVIFDIDGCVIHNDVRLPVLLAGDPDTYATMWQNDTALVQGCCVCNAFLSNDRFDVLFVTARKFTDEPHTLFQLQKLVNPFISESQLIMRPEGNDMPAGELKLFLIQSLGLQYSDIFLAFDDANSVVDAYRSVNITCYQTQFGDH